VTEDQRRIDDELADAALAVVVGVGTAHPDDADADQNLTGFGAGDGTPLHFDSARFDKNRSPHRRRCRRECCLRHILMVAS
jgi:hypothetical protein